MAVESGMGHSQVLPNARDIRCAPGRDTGANGDVGSFGVHQRPVTGRRVHPIQVDAGAPSACVTAGDALNLVDPETGWPADWHDFCWRSTHFPPRRAQQCSDPEFCSAAALLGADRTFDARPSLQLLRHPAGERAAPVWCAHHDRAIVELAWWLWNANYDAHWPIAPWTVADWLWTDAQMQSLKALAQKVEAGLPPAGVPGWRKWRLALRSFADHSDFA